MIDPSANPRQPIKSRGYPWELSVPAGTVSAEKLGAAMDPRHLVLGLVGPSRFRYPGNARVTIPSSVHVQWIDPWRQVRKRGIPLSLDGSEGIARVRRDGALADNHEPRPGPLVEPVGVGGSAAVVGSQEDIGGRLRRRTVDQLVETQLLEITRQEEMSSVEGDVEHETSRIVGGFRVPAVRRVRHRELNAGLFPRSGAVSGWTGIPSCSKLFDKLICQRIVHPGEPRWEPHFADREPVEQIGQAVVMVLIGVAQEYGVDRADAPRPERRRDDATTDGGITETPAIVQQSLGRQACGSRPPGHGRRPGIRSPGWRFPRPIPPSHQPGTIQPAAATTTPRRANRRVRRGSA